MNTLKHLILKKTAHLLFFALLSPLILSAQLKHDHTWIMG